MRDIFWRIWTLMRHFQQLWWPHPRLCDKHAGTPEVGQSETAKTLQLTYYAIQTPHDTNRQLIYKQGDQRTREAWRLYQERTTHPTLFNSLFPYSLTASTSLEAFQCACAPCEPNFVHGGTRRKYLTQKTLIKAVCMALQFLMMYQLGCAKGYQLIRHRRNLIFPSFF